MANLSKKKGSRKERELVEFLVSCGLQAWRLALAGVKDEEDVMVDTPKFGGVRAQVKYRRSTKHWRVSSWAREVAVRRDGEWWILVVPVPNKPIDRSVVVFDEEAARQWGLIVDGHLPTPSALMSVDTPSWFRGWCVSSLARWVEAVR